MTPEGKIKALWKREIAKLQGEGFRIYSFMPVQNGMGAPGLDFYHSINGHFVACETKAPGKWLTPRQIETVKRINGADGLVVVVDGLRAAEEAIAMIRVRCAKQAFTHE